MVGEPVQGASRPRGVRTDGAEVLEPGADLGRGRGAPAPREPAPEALDHEPHRHVVSAGRRERGGERAHVLQRRAAPALDPRCAPGRSARPAASSASTPTAGELQHRPAPGRAQRPVEGGARQRAGGIVAVVVLVHERRGRYRGTTSPSANGPAPVSRSARLANSRPSATSVTRAAVVERGAERDEPPAGRAEQRVHRVRGRRRAGDGARHPPRPTSRPPRARRARHQHRVARAGIAAPRRPSRAIRERVARRAAAPRSRGSGWPPPRRSRRAAGRARARRAPRPSRGVESAGWGRRTRRACAVAIAPNRATRPAAGRSRPARPAARALRRIRARPPGPARKVERRGIRVGQARPAQAERRRRRPPASTTARRAERQLSARLHARGRRWSRASGGSRRVANGRPPKT